MHSYFKTLGKYLLFTKYLTSTLLSRKKPYTHKKKLVPLKFLLVLVFFLGYSEIISFLEANLRFQLVLVFFCLFLIDKNCSYF